MKVTKIFFLYLVKKNKKQTIILIIDTFSYLLKNNSNILSILQNIIDQHLEKTTIKLILSGSYVGMIEDMIVYNKPLYGRNTFKIKLKPFDYYESSLFYPKSSLEDKIRLYAIFGGLPFYLNRIKDSKSVKQNIIDLVLDDGAIFEDEIAFFSSRIKKCG
ncbi:AAA family ATPase [Candidatus Phytoplasma luffae]|uniref:AAA family ATPase n=1 Tax=Loofah witches'-broom phytoplasma TaxID=35773 RepID=UPI001B39B0BB|nr:ATP-binding protein [Candidatus Phytoplasma luffae]